MGNQQCRGFLVNNPSILACIGHLLKQPYLTSQPIISLHSHLSFPPRNSTDRAVPLLLSTEQPCEVAYAEKSQGELTSFLAKWGFEPESPHSETNTLTMTSHFPTERTETGCPDTTFSLLLHPSLYRVNTIFRYYSLCSF